MDKEQKITVEELTKVQNQAQEYLAGWQRAMADYANFKKETEARAGETAQLIQAAFLLEILPLYNNLKLAIAHAPESEAEQGWFKGLVCFKKQFQEFLQKYQISEIKTVGEKFDPNFHEAVVCEEQPDCAPDTIFAEVMPGYLFADKVLSPAKVKVSK